MKDKSLGTTIAELRKQQGMTQLELARKMGVTDKAVSKWERDLSCPDISSFSRLAELLHVSVDKLLQSKTEPAPRRRDTRELVGFICRCIALATGVAVAVLSLLKQVELSSALGMLGIGLACLALDALQGGTRA